MKKLEMNQLEETLGGINCYLVGAGFGVAFLLGPELLGIYALATSFEVVRCWNS